MADPNLIACLFPYSNGSITAAFNSFQAVNIAENASFYVRPLREDRSRHSSQAPDGYHRGEDVGNDGGYSGLELEQVSSVLNIAYSLGLQLRFDALRKNRVGFVIGTSSSCDIVLPSKETLHGLAPRQCAITFDVKGQLILCDLQARQNGATGGTAVLYNGQGSQKRRNFTWVLGGSPFLHETKTA